MDSANGKKRSTRIWVLEKDSSSIHVATVSLKDRWRQIFEDIQLDEDFIVEILGPAEFKKRLAEAVSSTWLADGGWAMETLAAELIWEGSQPCESAELLVFTSRHGMAPLICAGPEALHELADEVDWSPNTDLRSAVETVSGKVSVKNHESGLEKLFWQKVTDKRTAKSAGWGMLKRLRMRPGGLVAQFLNRPISILISRLLSTSPITPNQATFIAFAIGLTGVAFVFYGEYWSAVLGTLLLHINSVLDGVDGELAILRHQKSEFGSYLDSICDEILNALILVASGVYLANAGWWPGYLYFGIASGSVSFFYALIHWHCRLKHGLGFYWWWDAYKPRKKVQRETTAFSYFKKLFTKDALLLFFFIAAIFNIMHLILWVSTFASAVVVVLFIIHIPIKRARW